MGTFSPFQSITFSLLSSARGLEKGWGRVEEKKNPECSQKKKKPAQLHICTCLFMCTYVYVCLCIHVFSYCVYSSQNSSPLQMLTRPNITQFLR